MSTNKSRKLEGSFAARFREARLKKGLTQEELARRLGVSNGAVGMWEIGPSKPRAETIARIAALLDTSIEHLLYGEYEGTLGPLRDALRRRDAAAREEIFDALDAHQASFARLCAALGKLRPKKEQRASSYLTAGQKTRRTRIRAKTVAILTERDGGGDPVRTKPPAK